MPVKDLCHVLLGLGECSAWFVFIAATFMDLRGPRKACTERFKFIIWGWKVIHTGDGTSFVVGDLTLLFWNFYRKSYWVL